MKKLFLVGMGISDERSIPLSGLDRIEEADVVFAEMFTSLLEEGSLDRLSRLTGKEIIPLGRRELEEDEEVMSAFNENESVCLLTAGDPLAATTHQELRLDAMRKGIDVEMINSGSIFTAAAAHAGLQHYKFGRTTTIGYPEPNFSPTSPLHVILENRKMGLHTLVLLDIRVHENRFMTSGEALSIILEMDRRDGPGLIGPELKVAALARIGRKDWKLVYGRINDVKSFDMGPPPHCMIIPGDLHFLEEEILERFSL